MMRLFYLSSVSIYNLAESHILANVPSQNNLEKQNDNMTFYLCSNIQPFKIKSKVICPTVFKNTFQYNKYSLLSTDNKQNIRLNMCFIKNWLCFVLLLHRFSPIEAEASNVLVITVSRLNCKMSIKNYFSCNSCDSQSFCLHEPKFKFQKLSFKYQEPEACSSKE